jgi:hypothetical protein
LKELTVDPKTVMLAKKVEAGNVGAPKPAMDLKAGTYHYKMTIEAGGQTMNLKVSTAIADGGPSWTATNEIETPQGNVTEKLTFEKTTLLLTNRNLVQGPVTIDVSFADNKASGKMSMNGQDRPIAADVGGPIFGDGADQVLACLPLAEGYSTNFRNFDLQSQKVRLMQLNVSAVEKVTVPAGTFDAYRLDVTSADGGSDTKTVWVAKDSLKVVKVSAVAASMGGAKITEELTE